MLYRQLLATMLGLAAATCAQAADWVPDRPIKLTVPYAAGGSADAIARVVANKIRGRLNQPVIVENKPGAGTIIGAVSVAKAPADGHTLLFATSTTMSIAPLTQKQLPYSPSQFVPIAGVMTIPFMLLVNKDVPADSIPQLIALSRGKPGVLNYGTLGTGTSNHVLGALLSKAAGDSMVAVHYTSAGPALIGLERGDIHVYFDGIPTSIHRVASGQYKSLAVTSAQRIPGVPDVPTVAEQGLPQAGLSVWYGLVAPAGTPEPVIRTLNAAVQAAIADPDVSAQITRDGAQPLRLPPEGFQELIGQDAAAWRKAFSSLDLKLD
ncbi:Bug family tripartite tricarboxylate transporter substrate binding protein [Bordetella genomosp. 13]|uniref:Bug family tripartite tricarboxylate transporter substrate binding protein n=1 Tax=Bordetella genomosp. 13 TaxID=463040 RepID=UPI0011A61AAC|nr:tripartite tricarboxylate transporter substrate binding protein [Bordetella genomosp. 13]